MDVALNLLRAAVDHPWESLMGSLRGNPRVDLGDPTTPGTGAWHLRHMLEVFREQAQTVAHELSPWASVPFDASPLAIADALLVDIDQFVAWHAARPIDAGPVRIHYGTRSMDLEEMIGVMTRHITWHAAAVHYWCRWKSPSEEGVRA